MKRLFLSLALAGSLSALAAPEKVLTVRVADTAEIISAVSRVGEFIGNPMLVLPLSAGITANPAAKVLGPARAGATTTVCVYADPEQAADFDALAKDAYVTLLYPVTPEKYAVLKDHPEALKKDGAHVVFSADGAWAGVSDEPARARAALDGIAAAQGSLAGDVLRAELTPAGVTAVSRLVDAVLGEMSKGDAKAAARVGELVACLRQVRDTSCALRVDASGITIRTVANAVPGTELAGLKPAPLASNALAFAGPDAVYAAAWSADCGQLDVADLDKACGKFAALFDKLGLKADWATYAKAGSTRKLTFDFDGCVKYFTTEGKAKIDALDPEAALREVEALKLDETRSLSLKNPAGALAFALKGADTQATPAMRFARVAPEAAAKKPYTVFVASLYAVCRTLAPKAVALLPAEERASVQPLLAALPPSGQGGFAAYAWQADDASWQGVLRVSPDEIKGLSACFNVAAGYMMQQQMKAMEIETDADDDADDED